MALIVTRDVAGVIKIHCDTCNETTYVLPPAPPSNGSGGTLSNPNGGSKGQSSSSGGGKKRHPIFSGTSSTLAVLVKRKGAEHHIQFLVGAPPNADADIVEEIGDVELNAFASEMHNALIRGDTKITLNWTYGSTIPTSRIAKSVSGMGDETVTIDQLTLGSADDIV
jgi:hypothetical protein